MSSILVTTRIPASALALLRGGAHEVDVAETALDCATLLRRVAGKDAIVCAITERIDRELLAAAGPALKIVANIAVGYDNIDVAAALERGVIVTNTPDVLTGAVAEFTWALMLAITRRLGEAERHIRRGEWKKWSLEFMIGSELAGKQLGIVGRGRIGRAVAEKAAAFGMSVRHFHPSTPTGDSAGRLSFDELLRTSDVISLHVPLTPATRHLINRKALTRMKRSAFLINTARGPIVDEEALAWALRERLIAGAALDVYEDEPRVHADLLELENVILAPHIGSATSETRKAMTELAARNVVAVLSGQAPLTPVAPAPYMAS